MCVSKVTFVSKGGGGGQMIKEGTRKSSRHTQLSEFGSGLLARFGISGGNVHLGAVGDEAL